MFVGTVVHKDDIPKDSEAWRLLESIFGGKLDNVEFRPKFDSIEQVEQWVARAPMGELALRTVLATERITNPEGRKLAEVWLQHAEAQRVDARATASLREAKRAADASESSAKWTLVAAVAAAVGALITGAGTFIMTPTPPIVQVTVQSPPAAPTPAVPKVESSPPTKPEAASAPSSKQ